MEVLNFKIDTIFKKYDANHNNKLEEYEVEQIMRDALREMGCKEQLIKDRVKLFISRVDKDGDNKISKEELLEALLPSHVHWFMFMLSYFCLLDLKKYYSLNKDMIQDWDWYFFEIRLFGQICIMLALKFIFY